MKELLSKPWSTAEFLDSTSKERACIGIENMDAKNIFGGVVAAFLLGFVAS
jgi:hypothetical protein